MFSHGDHLADFVAASEWLATQKIEDFDERCKAYIRSVFPSTESDDTASAWACPVDITKFEERSMEHRSYNLLSHSLLLIDTIDLF